MARVCEICSRGAQVTNSRSKSNIATKRLQKPNLQKMKIAGIRALVCSKCRKTMNKLTV